MDTVLFACVHNAGRSKMAAAWFNKICDRAKASVSSTYNLAERGDSNPRYRF
jgi:protein-tyrosine-phosphatase